MAVSPICSIPDCGKRLFNNGWCQGHYYRWARFGDPLGGKTPKGETERFIREVALKHLDKVECLLWPYGKDSDGYARSRVGGKSVIVSRYVCKEVHGEPPTPNHDAAHSCGNGRGGCINPWHLGWKTTAGNMADKLAHGTHQCGVKHGMSKLSEADARAIRALADLVPRKVIAAHYDISASMVWRIWRGKNWKHQLDEVA